MSLSPVRLVSIIEYLVLFRILFIWYPGEALNI